jgi:pSer/pThr/pTyr-binding forkhead associated (FHA) protein
VPKFDEDPAEAWASLSVIQTAATTQLAQHVSVSKQEFKIGRNVSNDLQVVNGKVSGSHCKLVKTGQKVELVDCSTNGTFKNGIRVDKKAILLNGDVIHLLIAGEGVSSDQQVGFKVIF